jgi:formylglycine-generating enzyme required for sulfatase activity
MKYEARNVGSVATSTPSSIAWTSISQIAAISACSSLGSGYHLITNTEWTALARNIEGTASNWSGGAVGSGVMSRGYSAWTSSGDSFTNTQVAPTTGTGYEYNTAANTSGPSGDFKLKRTHNLSNGQIIWDLAGNVWEWNSDTCTQGSGTGNWYNSSSWIEWSDSNLSDYELGIAGPNPLYTSTQNIGRYYNCTTGNGFRRGGSWSFGIGSGIFALGLDVSPSDSTGLSLGFRCAK